MANIDGAFWPDSGTAVKPGRVGCPTMRSTVAVAHPLSGPGLIRRARTLCAGIYLRAENHPALFSNATEGRLRLWLATGWLRP